MKRSLSIVALMITLFVSIIVLFFSCNKHDQQEEFTDNPSVELLEQLDAIPSEDLTESDLTLENGNKIIDFIQAYDSDFLEDNPWILEFNNVTPSSVDEDETRVMTKANGGITGNAGIVNLKNLVVSEMLIGGAFFLNDPAGNAINQQVKDKIADVGQKGLWYKWGGEKWYEFSYPDEGGEPLDGSPIECYGLDCSGFVFATMERIGFGISRENAYNYYNNLKNWNNHLKSFLATKTQFSNNIKDNLEFKKYVYSKSEIENNVEPGDIIFWGPEKGHMGIVGRNFIFQSNGWRHPAHAIDNSSTNTPRRGPRVIAVDEVHKMVKNVTQYGVIRLVANLNNTHWSLNIKCEGRDTYITSFDIEINLKESTSGDIPITPVSTIGYDYGGSQCVVYFTGSFNPETQVIKCSVTKTYSVNDTRTDGFEVKLIDDNIYDIVGSKIVSNGGCTNVLDLINLDNQTKANSANQNVNNSSSTNQKGDCTDGVVYID